MRHSVIKTGNVLPTPQKELERHFKDQTASGSHPRLDLKTLNALRNYKEYRTVVETERLRQLEKQYSAPDFMDWLDTDD